MIILFSNLLHSSNLWLFLAFFCPYTIWNTFDSLHIEFFFSIKLIPHNYPETLALVISLIKFFSLKIPFLSYDILPCTHSSWSVILLHFKTYEMIRQVHLYYFLPVFCWLHISITRKFLFELHTHIQPIFFYHPPVFTCHVSIIDSTSNNR